MSSRNADVVRRVYDAFRRGDIEAASRDVDPDVEWLDGAAWLSAIDTVLGGYSAWNLRDFEALVRLEAFRSRDEALQAVAYPETS